MQKLINTINNNFNNKTCVFVTNEVGAGIVLENALASKYRDVSGLCNQEIAKNATDVYFCFRYSYENKISFFLDY